MMIFLNYILCSLSIFTLIFDFERQVSTGDSVHTTVGTLYYEHDKRSVVDIYEPIEQIMIFDDDVWTVFYPQKNQAFVFGKSYFQVPFVDVLLALLKEDFGLINAGFQLLDSTVKEDTLNSVWQTRKMGFPVHVHLKQCKQVYTEFKLVRNDTVRIFTTFDRFYQLQGKLFPQSIVSRVLTIRDEKPAYNIESLKISNYHVNESIPDSIQNLEIPTHCQIKYMNQN